MTREQAAAVQTVALGLLESICEAGDMGAPSGILYAGVNAAGVSLSQYQQIMWQMEGRGFVVQEGDCYTMTSSGQEFMHKLQAQLGARQDVAMRRPQRHGC